MIKIKDVSFVYSGRDEDGLHGISLELKKGEFMLVCGRSGSGKTSVTRLINGLIPYFHDGDFSGEVTVRRMNISESPMYIIAETVGSVFQNPRTQFFNVDTDSEIVFGMENAGEPLDKLKSRLKQTTDELGIENLLSRNIFELSGGEKQKIAFASVYAMNPDVYVLDEPSSSLDAAAIGELKKKLKILKGQGKTVVIAEHRLHYLMDIVDKIVFMDRGRAQLMTPSELKALSDDARHGMGLRAPELLSVTPANVKISEREPVFELKNVSVCYGKRTVLDGLNLKVSRGEVVAVAGRNGAGKTTFSRTLCGLHKECRGEFLWNGKPRGAKVRLKNSYMVMQDVNYQLFAESVESECSFGVKKSDPELVTETLHYLGLAPYKDFHPNTLSGGQKQRTAVAVSIVSGKEVIVFDEPTSGLDYDSMTQVSSLIEKLAQMGRVVFVVTHDYEFVCASCSRVLHFADGILQDDISVSVKNREKLKELFLI